jgi:predicted RNA polymerase sigma factor
MIKDPKKWLAESERLADARGTANYKLAAEILADLKEAIGGAKGAQIAHKHAAHLTRKHPTMTRLKGSLRKRGVLD